MSRIHGMLACVALIFSMSATTSWAQFSRNWIKYEDGLIITLDSVPPNPGIGCYSTFGARSKKNGAHPASEVDTASTDECIRLDNSETLLGDEGEYQQAYDTARAYLTLCYNQPYSYGMFSAADDDNDVRNFDTTRYDEFREWLKSVLYLRIDTNWYCADVYAIIRTLRHYPGHGDYSNGMEAIIRYILEHNRCDSEWTALIAGGDHYPADIYITWRDTVQDSIRIDTLKNRLGMDSIVDSILRPDTTVPSIDSIGLSILRGPQYAGVAPAPIASGADNISGLYVTENPFTNSTEIKFNLAEYGLVTFQLFDVLGHAVTTNGIGQVLYPGAHEFDIDGSKLAPGNYIARVAYHDGEVESILVVRK